jgi:hypothetical protein
VKAPPAKPAAETLPPIAVAPKAAVETPVAVENRAEKPLLDVPLSLPIVTPAPTPAKANAKAKPDVDEGAFWSDGDDDNDDDAPIDIKLPDDDDDDDLVLKPNPLVTGRARAVDLTASIRSFAEDQKKELVPAPAFDEEPPPLPPPLDPEALATAAGPPLPSETAEEYGELADDAPAAEKTEKRAAKVRPRLRARGRGSGPPAEEE